MLQCLTWPEYICVRNLIWKNCISLEVWASSAFRLSQFPNHAHASLRACWLAKSSIADQSGISPFFGYFQFVAYSYSLSISTKPYADVFITTHLWYEAYLHHQRTSEDQLGVSPSGDGSGWPDYDLRFSLAWLGIRVTYFHCFDWEHESDKYVMAENIRFPGINAYLHPRIIVAYYDPLCG